jgi:peptidoglycan/xylan/chitin deacetylase (PgdA/CDA1 family)
VSAATGGGTRRPVFLLARAVLAALRLSRAKLGLALAYHKIDERPGDSSNELLPAVARTRFEAHLRYLVADYRVVPASDLLAAAGSRRRGQRFPVAVTADDDLRTHVAFAAPALEARGLRGAFFLCGASLDEPHTFWWEALQQASDSGVEGLDDLVRSYTADAPRAQSANDSPLRRLAARIEEMTPERRDALTRAIEIRFALAGPSTRFAGSDVRALAVTHEIGFHTLRHDALDLLGDDSLQRALEDGRRTLEAEAGRRLTMIAYPHGRADERVAAAARLAGFEFGFGGGWGAARASTDPLLIPRVSAPPADVPTFALRLVAILAREAARLTVQR